MSTQHALAALQRKYLFPFAWKSFEQLHGGEPFLSSWHVEAICYALQQVIDGSVRRLIITVPPRYGKSLCAAVALPAWVLGLEPHRKIMVASYGSDLATKHARDFRKVILSEKYKALFPKTILQADGNRVDEQVTTAGGGRKAVSLGGAATGFGADIIIIDDLMKAGDASSEVERQRVKDYYEQTLLSRLNDKREGAIIVIQQRLHEDDLVGHLLATGQFTHLNLQAIADEDQTVLIGEGRTKQRKKGEALCPEREPLETLEQMRIEMGAATFSAQYQQNPTPPGGNRIRWEWFGTYDAGLVREDFQQVVQSWDTGLTAEPTSDFSVGTTWGFRDGYWHLLDLTRKRMNFPELKSTVVHLAKVWRADGVLIEHAGSGISLFQQLKAENKDKSLSLRRVTPRLDKQLRLEAQSARLETGRYLLPATAPWLSDFKSELLAFPKGKHDDQVDSMVQFVEWAASPRGHSFMDRDPITHRPKGRDYRLRSNGR